MSHFKKLLTFRQRFFFLSLILLTILNFLFLDRQILPWILPWTQNLRYFFKCCSFLIFPPLHLGIWLGAFLFIRFFKRNHPLTLPFFEIAITQCAGIALVRLSKVLIGRARPDLFIAKGIYGFYGIQMDHHFHAFPSGHTMTAFTLASSFSLLAPRFRSLFLSGAFLLSMSRVVLLDHYLSDVIGTACLGSMLAVVIHTLLTKITNQNKRLFYENP